jgi:hypothetical protein
MAIKILGNALKIMVGRVSRNAGKFVFGLIRY